ncbi:tubulin epsilon and delta complex protein 2 [Ctenodactylus gundi]
MLPADVGVRLIGELQGALDACAERQRHLERSLRVSRRLLRAWEPVGTPAPKPPPGLETKEEARSPACAPSPQDLQELEFLTQALEKAARVRKSVCTTRERDRVPGPKSASVAPPPGPASRAPPLASSLAGHSTKGIHQTSVPAKVHSERRLPLVGDVRLGAQVCGRKPGHKEQTAPSTTPQATEAFTLQEKGTLLKLPAAFKKVASRNSCLWAQLNSTQTSDFTHATSAAKAQFLQKLQMASGLPGPRLSAVEIEVESRRLRKACVLLTLRMREELSAAPADRMQEYRSLFTLERLQALVGQCLHRLQELRAGDGGDASGSPQLLLYCSTQELQTLAALRLRVAMLQQQVHLEEVFMAELLPLVNTQEPRGPPWLALCRATHSLLCEGGEHFLSILQDDPVD